MVLHKTTYLPLSGEVTEAGRDTEDEAVKLGQLLGGNDGVWRLCGSMHLLEDSLGECLRDPGGLVSTADVPSDGNGTH